MKARRMLGGHAKSTEKSALTYSRDTMAWPLRELGRVLRLVELGEFNPDQTRSGTFLNLDDATAADALAEADRLSKLQEKMLK